MNGPGHQLLAGSGLTENENGRIAGGNLFNFIENIIERVTLADNVLMIVLRFDFFLQIRSLDLQFIF
jgi:hypothetical protein